MEAFSTAAQRVQAAGEKEDQVVYIEELSGEGDYWLSITDAARVCRVQDVSIRRAITRGALPVRRQRAGQNKRTRFVRASDLPAVGFPIIDESAAITTEIGKADILSIPRQQQRIQQDHQILMARLQEIQETLEHFQASLRADLQQQTAEIQSDLRTLQEEQARQRGALETRLLQGQERLQQDLAAAEERLDQGLQSVRQEAEHAREETLQRESALVDMLRAHQEAFERLQRESRQAFADLEARQQQLRIYQQMMTERFQQAEQEAHERLAALEQQLTDRLETASRALDAQLQTLTAQVAHLQQSSESLSQQVTLQKDEQARLFQQQQAQLEQLEQLTQLFPLLPYAHQALLTREDGLIWTQGLLDLEQRLTAGQQEQQNALARFQPLLDLLSPERLETLTRLLDAQQKTPFRPTNAAEEKRV